MTRIELTYDAERDLIDIYLFGIEHFGQAQAERYAETLNGKMAVAAETRDSAQTTALSGLACGAMNACRTLSPTDRLTDPAFWFCASCMAEWTQGSISHSDA